MDQLKKLAAEVIFAEPVGSCTDLSATTLKPLQKFRDYYRIAPFTVLVDPQQARTLLNPMADQHLRFLFENQIREADLICFTKSDLKSNHSAIEHLPIEVSGARQISARTGQGVAAWLDEVLSGQLSAGTKNS